MTTVPTAGGPPAAGPTAPSPSTPDGGARVADPPVPVVLGLPETAVRVAGPEAVRDAVAGVVDAVLDALRIPGRAEVTVDPVRRESDGWLLRVHDERLRSWEVDVPTLVREASGDGSTDLGAADADTVLAVVAGFCTLTVLSRPPALLSAGQAQAVLARAGVPVGGQAADALVAALDCGVALDDAAVRDAVGAPSEGRHAVEIAEALIESGRRPTVDVVVERSTLRRLTTGERPEDRETFLRLRESLYGRFGILGPDLRFDVDDAMPPGRFAFRLNAVRTWPRPLSATGGLADIASALAALVRHRAHWFVSVLAVDEMSGRLAMVIPETVAAVRERYPLPWLTSLVRVAVEEGSSLRHLATVLDRLLDMDPDHPGDLYRLREGTAPVPDRGLGGLLRPRDALCLLRQRDAEERFRTVADDAVMVLGLTADLEDELAAAVTADSAPFGGEASERLGEQVRRLTAQGAGLPLVVTSVALRRWLVESLRGEFPELTVVARRELPPGVRVGVIRP